VLVLRPVEGGPEARRTLTVPAGRTLRRTIFLADPSR
jgi:hypothetical protein